MESTSTDRSRPAARAVVVSSRPDGEALMEVEVALVDAQKNDHDDGPGRGGSLVPAAAFNWQFMSRLMRSFVGMWDRSSETDASRVRSRSVRVYYCCLWLSLHALPVDFPCMHACIALSLFLSPSLSLSLSLSIVSPSHFIFTDRAKFDRFTRICTVCYLEKICTRCGLAQCSVQN